MLNLLDCSSSLPPFLSFPIFSCLPPLCPPPSPLFSPFLSSLHFVSLLPLFSFPLLPPLSPLLSSLFSFPLLPPLSPLLSSLFSFPLPPFSPLLSPPLLSSPLLPSSPSLLAGQCAGRQWSAGGHPLLPGQREGATGDLPETRSQLQQAA